MKTLIVTASSKSKRDSVDNTFEYTDQRFINSINEKNRKAMRTARDQLIKDMGVEAGPDLDEIKISETDGLFLPAYLRYSGRTYSKINLEAWDNLNQNQDKFDCVILSALYGLIRYNEPIRLYEIKQADKIPNKSTIQNFWKNQGAADWLVDYIKKNEIDDVKFVLSTSYAGIVNRDKIIPMLNDDLGINAEDHQYKSTGRKSMLLRGKYINDLLTT